jgi:catechol 2,3-dioxygenase-like lactoylglutathione lyase family enzyme
MGPCFSARPRARRARGGSVDALYASALARGSFRVYDCRAKSWSRAVTGERMLPLDSGSGLADKPLVALLATANADRSRYFFENVLGLRLLGDDAFALVFDANGTTLRVQKVEEVHPAAYTALGWQTDNIEQIVRQLVERGVHFERYAGVEQDTLGIWISPGGAKIAWFKDPDGNILSLTELPTSVTTERR